MRNLSPASLEKLKIVVAVCLILMSHATVFGFHTKNNRFGERIPAMTSHFSNRQSSTTDSTVLGEPAETTNRRSFLSEALIASGVLALASTAAPRPAEAKDEAFRSNPLTNPVLEQVRIWEQAEADELYYGGELERGDAGNKGKVGAYPTLLLPILKIADELQRVDQMVHQKDQWGDVQRVLKQPEYQTTNFKKIFNAFGDNIYYADPDRANLYLGGGATPTANQSLAYLLRNDILTNVGDLQAEIDYLLQHEGESPDDLYTYARGATNAIKQYLDNVPPGELKRAKEL